MTIAGLFYENEALGSKVPEALVNLCEGFMDLKLKDVDRKYLNKISFFCEEAFRVFDYENFDQLVRQYFLENTPCSLIIKL